MFLMPVGNMPLACSTELVVDHSGYFRSLLAASGENLWKLANVQIFLWPEVRMKGVGGNGGVLRMRSILHILSIFLSFYLSIFLQVEA